MGRCRTSLEVDGSLVADATGNGVPDVEDAVRTSFRAGAQLFRSFSFGTGTNFQNPANSINNLLARAPEAAKNQVFFLTDGQASNPSTSTLEQIASFGVEFHGFQITGSSVSGSLQLMADTIDAVAGASGSALVVQDPNELTSTIVGSLGIGGSKGDGGHFYKRPPSPFPRRKREQFDPTHRSTTRSCAKISGNRIRATTKYKKQGLTPFVSQSCKQPTMVWETRPGGPAQRCFAAPARPGFTRFDWTRRRGRLHSLHPRRIQALTPDT